MSVTGDYTVKIQECKVKGSRRPEHEAVGHALLQVPHEPAKIHERGALGLAGGDRMFMSRTDDDVYVLSRKRLDNDDVSVTLSETVTRKYNGRTYTIIKFVIPRALATKLKVYKGKEVELHLRGDRIIMLF